MHKWLELSIPAKQPIVDAKEKNPKYYDKIKGNKRLFRGGKKEMKWLTSDETVPIVRKLYCVLSIIPVGRGGGCIWTSSHQKDCIPQNKAICKCVPFVVNSTNLRHGALTTHKNSETRKYAVEFTASRNMPLTSHKAKALQKKNSSFTKQSYCFKIVETFFEMHTL